MTKIFLFVTLSKVRLKCFPFGNIISKIIQGVSNYAVIDLRTQPGALNYQIHVLKYFEPSLEGGFPQVQTVKNLPVIQETGFDLWVGKIPWREYDTHSNILPGEFHG